MAPHVSVLVRSYNRLATMCELVERLLHQTYPSFEIVIVEQSLDVSDLEAARIAAIAAHARVRLVRSHPLGGAAARNLGVAHCRGEVIVFIDDDDLPLHDDFLAAHVRAYEDPRCLGVSGRHVFNDDPDHAYAPLRAWLTRTLSYDPILKLPLTYVQHDRRRIPVEAIHGTNASIRRSVYERFGGWDTDTRIEDEVSFCMRVQRGKAPDEYFAYDPRPTLLRNRDVGGGLDKRRMSATDYYGHYLDFVHRIVGRYHPVRLVALYPLYLIAAYLMSVGWLFENSRRYRSVAARVGVAALLLATSPYFALRSLARRRAGATGPARPAPARAGAAAARRAASR